MHIEADNMFVVPRVAIHALAPTSTANTHYCQKALACACDHHIPSALMHMHL